MSGALHRDVDRVSVAHRMTYRRRPFEQAPDMPCDPLEAWLAPDPLRVDAVQASVEPPELLPRIHERRVDLDDASVAHPGDPDFANALGVVIRALDVDGVE